MSQENQKWFTKEQVIWIHSITLGEHGGAEGIRDDGLLESALARPQNLHHYESVSCSFELTASYAEGLARNHPFSDGNKRSAYLVAALFLRKAGYDLQVRDEKAQVVLFERFASGHVSRHELAQFYRKNCIDL